MPSPPPPALVWVFFFCIFNFPFFFFSPCLIWCFVTFHVLPVGCSFSGGSGRLGGEVDGGAGGGQEGICIWIFSIDEYDNGTIAPLIASCSGPEWCHNGGTPTLGKTSQCTAAERSKHWSPSTGRRPLILHDCLPRRELRPRPPGGPDVFKVKPSQLIFSQAQKLWSLVVFDCGWFSITARSLLCMRTLHSDERLGRRVEEPLEVC